MHVQEAGEAGEGAGPMLREGVGEEAAAEEVVRRTHSAAGAAEAVRILSATRPFTPLRVVCRGGRCRSGAGFRRRRQLLRGRCRSHGEEATGAGRDGGRFVRGGERGGRSRRCQRFVLGLLEEGRGETCREEEAHHH